MPTSVTVRIERFLAVLHPNAYCTFCLAQSLGIEPEDVAEFPRIGRPVIRQVSACALCGLVKVTLAAPQAAAA